MGKKKNQKKASSASSPPAQRLKNLVHELREHNDFFDVFLDIIPSKVYIAEENGDNFNPKYHYKQKVRSGDDSDDEGVPASKEARRAASKLAKRRKLNPDVAETTSQKLVSKRGGRSVMPKAGASSTEPAHHPSGKSRIEALREKLHAKIAEKQALRPNGCSTGSPEATSKRAARRAEKLRRQEEAKSKKKAASTATTSNGSGGGNNNKSYKVEDGSSYQDALSRDLESVDFGRLAGLNGGKSPTSTANYLEANKALANLNKTKNVAKLLADAEEKREKLKKLKQGSEEEKAKAKAIQWADTFKEADGHRVKDDPKKLKKVLKKKAAKKAKSQKAWKARMENTVAAKDQRQKIRQHNLSARKQGGKVGANLSRKKIVDEAGNNNDGSDKDRDVGRRLSTSSRPGFEGRKKDFINDKRTSTGKSKNRKMGAGKGGGGGKE